MITNKNFIVLIACLFVSSNDLLALGADTPQSGSRPTDVRDSKSGTPGNSAGVPPGFKPGEQEAIAAHDQSLKTKNDTSDLSAEAPPVATPTSLDVSDINTTEVKNDNVNDSSVEQPAVENKPAFKVTEVTINQSKNVDVVNPTHADTEVATVENGSIKITLADVKQEEEDFSVSTITEILQEGKYGKAKAFDPEYTPYHADGNGDKDVAGFSLSSTQENRERMTNLDVAAFKTIQDSVVNIKAELTSAAMVSRKLLPKSEQEAYKRTIAAKTIQSQIDNVCGIDRFSLQSNVKLLKAVQDKLINDMVKEQGLFDDPNMSDFEREALIAKHCNATMKIISGDIATVTTTVDSKTGKYTSTIVKNGVSTVSVVDASGKRISTEYAIVGGPDAPSVTFRTSINQESGNAETWMTKSDGTNAQLIPEDASTIVGAHGSFNAAVGAKMALKAVVYSGTKVAPAVAYCVVTAPVTPAGIMSTLAIEMAKASSLGLYKVYSVAPKMEVNIRTSKPINILGYTVLDAGTHTVNLGGRGDDWSDPAMVYAANRIAASLGDSRGIFSGQQDRVFMKGSIASKFLSGNWSEQPDPSEPYYTWLNVTSDASKKIFGQGNLAGGTFAPISIGSRALEVTANNVSSAAYSGFKSMAKSAINIGATPATASGVAQAQQ